MKYINHITTLALLVLVACQSKQQSSENTEEETLTPQLSLVWESDTLLTTCESALYHGESATIYVANINQGPWEKDGNGFISKLDTNGNILSIKWAVGLHAPKGMGIHDGKLYVNDIDDIVEIDLATGSISNTYTLPDNPQLNDLTIGKDGTVYASGSNSNSIHVLQNGEIVATHGLDSVQRLNGLLATDNGMYFLDFKGGAFGLLDLDAGTTSTVATGITQGDGIVQLPNNDFITSAWGGQLFYIEGKTGKSTLLLDTREQSINAADIDYISEQNLLLVPTFFHNRVMAYRVEF
ncbi:NHL repeat-containing protein [Marinoscillum furvescens]|uniref:Uncharacterized protein n=1 Tax=Marinoscillum furvescens DSM 4134 TaxID=1122208 RepID=A0A3D9L551_MARFU|nr:ATP-binding protein [Marinoscillum furvescens]REE01153.1 hypothetical protein C7460_104173 [Marinoscillum furvescens DSM 4134]